MTEAERRRVREERAEQRRSEQAADIVGVLATPGGRRFVARLVYEFGGLKVAVFNSDPCLSAYYQGQRAVGAALEKEVIRAAPGSWQTLESERTARIATEPLEKPVETEDDIED